MNGKRTAEIFLAALLLACFSRPTLRAADLPAGKPGPGEPAPMFVADDLEGRRISLEEVIKSGNVVFLNFWGLRCANCIVEIGYLNPMFEKYRGMGVMFLGVNVDGAPADAIRRMMPKMANVPRYTVLPDPELKIPESYNLAGAPLSFVIGRNGMITYRHEDFNPGDEKELEDALGKALAAGR
jgi:peroxiredoxin